MSCPICSGDSVKRPFRRNPEYVECKRCGFLWRTDRERIAQWNRIYHDQDFADEEARQDPQRAEYHRRQLAMIHRHVAPPGRLLEIACGTGELLRLAVEAGWEASGIEPSSALCQIAGLKIGAQHVICSTVAEASCPKNHYDCVAAIDVLEHIVDPQELIGKAREYLRQGGFLVLQTPNARSLRRFIQGSRWNLLAPDRHVLFHTRASLSSLLEIHEFKAVGMMSVSGRSTDRGVLRVAADVYGRILSHYTLGNALWAIAVKE